MNNAPEVQKAERPAIQRERGGANPAPALTRWHFHTNQLSDATELVERFHYSGRLHTAWFVATAHLEGGLFGDFGPAVAACVFGIPPTRWAEEVVELTRLVRRDDVVINLSALVSYAVRQIRKHRQECDLIVSFADATVGHHGGIYQACSWNYHGQRAPANQGLMINGEFVPGRTCNTRWGTRSAARLRELHPNWLIEECWDAGKHLYWKAVRGPGVEKARRLGLLNETYPKPAQNEAA